MPKSLASAENCQEKVSFVLILTKPDKPIFQSAGPTFGPYSLRGNIGDHARGSTQGLSIATSEGGSQL